jgi:transposase
VKRLRQDYCVQIRDASTTLAEHLKFIDEFGAHLGLTRLFGRAAPGERVVEATSGYSGAHYTVVATLGLQGITAPCLFEGAMNGITFETYVEKVLAPTLHPGDLVVIDNLSAHKGEPIGRLIEACGAQVHFLPPYSPDLNPIELCWAKVKTALRAAKARTFDALVNALWDALRAINPADIIAWFVHCGYTVNP